jgi:subtilisin family serine protease
MQILAQEKGRYVSNELVVKLKLEYSNYFEVKASTFNEVFRAEILDVKSTFPKVRKMNYKNQNVGFVDLSLIKTLRLTDGVDISGLISELKELDVFEYIERKRIRYTSATPNDPKLNLQNYLTQINAYVAWDVSIGGSTVKIGIVDTGTDMDHPDLQSKMTENASDPINGIDDDGDGYIDNYNGWDFVDQDGEPQIVSGSHGVHVAGIAAAATNNGEGVASIGYKTKFMPIRAGDGSLITHGYEGIVYAADMGCDIINCSWGGFDASALEQDVINYATYNKNALVVCAAGNQNKDQAHYPAAYENAFAVAAVSSIDKKSNISNYGYWVDISAPGESIYSTVNNGGYNHNTGTSMAAPMVSGAAALVKAVYPQLTAKQIIERLKQTGNDINGSNPVYVNKIGKSRLNVGNAVSGNIQQASVVFENMKITNKTDDVFKGNDSLFISGTFTNYLAVSSSVTATIQTSSPYVVVNHDVDNLGIMNSLLQLDNFDTPFSFKILNTAPINSNVTFEVVLTDGVFTNKYFFDIVVNVDYLNIAVNNIAMSLGSKGQVGYNGRNQNQGLGIKYKNGISQLFEGGLMIGTNGNGFVRVVDRVRNGTNSWDNDFKVENYIQSVTPPTNNMYALSGVFNDSNAMADTIGIQVLYRSYASTDPGHENYVVLEYEVVNTNSSTLNDLHVGLFADFDVLNFEQNKSHTDLKRYLTYTKDNQPNAPCFGVQLLTPGEFHSYCLDNVNGGAGGVDIYNGYNNSKKYTTLSSNRYASGIGSVNGNDVIQVTSMGNISIAPGDTFKVAFAVIAADAVVMLEQVADSAYTRYNGSIPNSISELEVNPVKVFPNPAGSIVNIEISENLGKIKSIKIFDITGKEVFHVNQVNHFILKLDFVDYNNGVYLVEIQLENRVWVTKLIKNSR